MGLKEAAALTHLQGMAGGQVSFDSVHLDELDFTFRALELLFEVGALKMPSIVFLSFKHFFARDALVNFEVLEMHLPLVSVDLAPITEAEVAERALIRGLFVGILLTCEFWHFCIFSFI